MDNDSRRVNCQCHLSSRRQKARRGDLNNNASVSLHPPIVALSAQVEGHRIEKIFVVCK